MKANLHLVDGILKVVLVPSDGEGRLLETMGGRLFRARAQHTSGWSNNLESVELVAEDWESAAIWLAKALAHVETGAVKPADILRFMSEQGAMPARASNLFQGAVRDIIPELLPSARVERKGRKAKS